MPNNLQPANPTTVMPSYLCQAFEEDLKLEIQLNNYPDGTAERNALAQNVRHYFKLQSGLTPNQYQSLWNFYSAHQADAFYFYFLRETVPPWTADPSGNATQGRYTVVFDGAWTDTYNKGRTSVALALREVA
jgi:hypothetical protein